MGEWWRDCQDVGFCSFYMIRIDNLTESSGVCNTIVDLHTLNLINVELKCKMREKVQEEARRRKKDPDNFIWSLTRRGALARSRFCFEMARGCK